jgi:lambda repressor-like predicted transcriptional regulator
MSAVLAAAPLDIARIRKTIREVRATLAQARDQLTSLYDELAPTKGWTKLGHTSWEVLCREEMPELAQMLTVAQKQELVVDLRKRGMSLRAAAAPAGVSAATAKTWTDNAGVQLATVTSLDGRQRPAKAAAAEPAPVITGAQRTVDLVAKAGERGLTVRELCKKTGWHHGQASGQLSRLAKQRRVRAVAVFRDGCAAYVVSPWA